MNPMAETQQRQCLIHFTHPEHAVGDVHPYYENGVYHVNYLYTPGTWNVAQLRTRDFLNWSWETLSHAQMGRDPSVPNFFVLHMLRDNKQSLYHTFYGNGGMYHSVSEDMLNWRCAQPHRILAGSDDLYKRQSDPYVFWNDTEGAYWLVMTLRKRNLPILRAGAIGFAVSPDLKNWEYQGELYCPGDRGDPECPSMFRMGDYWYLLASYSDGRVGKPSYRISASPRGPWTEPFPDSLDGEHLCAAESCYDGRQRLLLGWVPLRFSETGKQHWGGHLALPREIYPLNDGRLASRLEKSVAAAIRGTRVDFGWNSGDWNGLSSENCLPKDILLSETNPDIRLSEIPDNIDVEIRFVCETPQSDLRVVFDSETDSAFAEVHVDFDSRRLRIVVDGERYVCSVGIDNEDNRSHTLRMICDRDILECFLDDRFTLVARLPRPLEHNQIDLSAEKGLIVLNRTEIYRIQGVCP